MYGIIDFLRAIIAHKLGLNEFIRYVDLRSKKTSEIHKNGHISYMAINVIFEKSRLRLGNSNIFWENVQKLAISVENARFGAFWA